MLIDILLILAGLVLLVGGGHALIEGASALAKRLGVSMMVIGLTTVAFGTSVPELAVSVYAASTGSTAIAFGNVVGSNIANVALLLGITACIRPLAVHGQVVMREIPMMLLASCATLALALDSVLGTGSDEVQRGDGVVLLLLFCVFLYYTIGDALRQRADDALLKEAEAVVDPAHSPGKSVTLVLVGLAGLIVGGRLLVDSGVEVARALAVPEIVIGVTVVAIGTSMPELVTCIIAVRKGMNDLAVGNIVGSNIFNLLFVLGATATILPVAAPGDGWVDLLVMTGLALVLLPIAVTHQRSITRLEGVVLIAAYVSYAAWQVAR